MPTYILLLIFLTRVGADSVSAPDTYQYASFSPSMAVIIAVLISALFFMGFFSIYIRHCSETSSSTTVRNLGASLRRRAAARGLDASILETFPTFGYAEVKGKKIGKGTLECAVCLNEFVEEDRLRLIPKCSHVFHPDCINAWLESHVTCPVCRANLSEPITESSEQEQNGEVSVSITQETEQEMAEPERMKTRSQSTGAKIWPKFPRSHSTGHSNVDRFTLRLPEEVRKQMMTRALDRTRSCVVVFPTESSSRNGYRAGFGRSLKRVDLVAKSDRWVFSMAPPFLSRGPSMRSPKGDVEDGEGSTSAKKGTMKLPSFKCLVLKGDESFLISDQSSRPPV